MPMTKLELVPSISVCLIPSEQRYLPVSWFIDSVCLGFPPSRPEHAAEQSGTTGSSLEIGDELRFDAVARDLQSGVFSVPEENGDWSAWQDVALAGATGKGSLRLVRSDPFILPAVDVRVFAPDGSCLMALSRDTTPVSVAHRLEIAPGFRLLFTDDSYCGWILLDPIPRLRCDPRGPLEIEFAPAGQEAALFGEYFGLVNEDSMDELFDGNAALKARLQELRSRIPIPVQAKNPALEALCEKIDDLLDYWF